MGLRSAKSLPAPYCPFAAAKASSAGRRLAQIRGVELELTKKPPLNWKKPFLACSAEAFGARKTAVGTPCTCIVMYQGSPNKSISILLFSER